MRKYLTTMVVMTVFAIGFAASDDDVGSNSSSSQTEQKQETPAEREAREKQEKVKKVAEIAYKMGYDRRKATWGETIASEDAAAAEYRYRYAVDPEDAGQSERWNVFRENYQKGFSDAADEIIKKFRSEDF